MDRTINWGDDAADARYRTQDTSSTGGDFVVAEDLDGGTVLLEYDYSASEWVSRGPVNLNGNDITNAGSISADTLEAESLAITQGLKREESPNNPFSGENQQSVSINVDNKYDFIKVFVSKLKNTSGSSQDIYVRVNNNTAAEYRYTDIANNTTGDDSSGWLIVSGLIPGYSLTGSFRLDNSLRASFFNETMFAGSSPDAVYGTNDNKSSTPIDSIQIRGGSGDIDLTAYVIGFWQ